MDEKEDSGVDTINSTQYPQPCLTNQMKLAVRVELLLHTNGTKTELIQLATATNNPFHLICCAKGFQCLPSLPNVGRLQLLRDSLAAPVFVNEVTDGWAPSLLPPPPLSWSGLGTH